MNHYKIENIQNFKDFVQYFMDKNQIKKINKSTIALENRLGW